MTTPLVWCECTVVKSVFIPGKKHTALWWSFPNASWELGWLVVNCLTVNMDTQKCPWRREQRSFLLTQRQAGPREGCQFIRRASCSWWLSRKGFPSFSQTSLQVHSFPYSRSSSTSRDSPTNHDLCRMLFLGEFLFYSPQSEVMGMTAVPTLPMRELSHGELSHCSKVSGV